MGQINPPPPAKLFIAMIVSEDAQKKLDYIDTVIQKEFGTIDIVSSIWPFDYTDYYKAEMGDNLTRRIVSFEQLIDPSSLAEIKLKTNQLEEEITLKIRGDSIAKEEAKRRAINLDAGYLTLGQIVLATTKSYSHRIYLRDGIWAEVTLFYYKGRYKPWQWTYPDYASGRYDEFWNKMREKLKSDISRTQKF